ncbi:Mus7/MMS22 family-domain-containing protein [Aspergillus varians]
MQMESWRKRGFVPDSDDEDGLDSQEKGVNQDAHSDNSVSVASTVRREEAIGTTGSGRDGVDNQRRDDAHDDDFDFMEEKQDSADAVDEDIDLPLPSERLQTLNDDMGGSEPDLGDLVAEDNRSTRGGETSRARAPEVSSTAGKCDQSLTPRTQKQRDFWDIPSSSPDLLQLDYHPWRRQTSSPSGTPTPKARDASQAPLPEENVDISPLSSPLSSLHSSLMGENDQQLPEEPPNQTLEEHTLEEHTLEELLPPLDIPEDILRELDQPTRRSLRQRNPIQLHPYLLEDAKYQRLMKARGVKPVRIAQQLQQRRAAAHESQGQSFGDDAGFDSDTQMSSFQFPPSSPIDSRQLFEITPVENTVEKGNRQDLQQARPSANDTGPHSPKRRKVLGPRDDRPGQKLRPVPRPAPHPAPQVVINNVSLSLPRDAPSVFDIPSPPRSGSVSSPPTQEDTGFRFPRGFSPPTITPRTETRQSTKTVNDKAIVIDEDESAIDQESDDSRTVRSVSPHSRPASDLDDREDEDAQEAIVRRYQRKIKGVLPASWLRLDQQKRKGLPGATQQNNDRISRLETEVAKGVARKITKKADASVPSSAREQLSSLRQLAEESEGEGAESSDDTDSVGSRQHLASLLGLEDSFLDQDPRGDIPEDNRIDDMFPTTSRNAALSNGRKYAKKRRRLVIDEARPHGQLKKPRPKRQARLTDALYGGQKKKRPRPSQSLPKLGILDAPDVTSQPRKEQPQFLRIAARKARSRQDRGRRSPTRKVIRLNSRLDTEDANASLREWHSGRLRQTTLPSVPSQARRRQPLRDLSTNARDLFNGLGAKKVRGRIALASTQRAAPSRNNSVVRENGPAMDAPSDSRSNNCDAVARPAQQRRGNAWVIQRNLAISSLSRNNPRPVVPEIESRESTTRVPSSLQRSLALLGRDERLPLSRFLSGNSAPQKSSRATAEVDKLKHASQNPIADSGGRRRLKKRPPKRLDPTTIEDHGPPVNLPQEPEFAEPRTNGQLPHDKAIGQLNRFRTAYSVDFDVSPLHSGIFFHESTFIGSGEFSRSLDIGKRYLDKSTGLFHFRFGDLSMRWGAWDDSVSSQFGIVFDQILEAAETGRANGERREASPAIADSGCAMYRSLIRYTSEALSFIDPIDRTGFITRANDLVSNLIEDLSNMISTIGYNTEQLSRIASHNVVFANQVCQIACHDLVNQTIRDEAFNLAKSASRQAVSLISNPTGQAAVRRFLAASKLPELREAGIKNDYPTIEAYVIVQHVFDSTEFKGCLKDFIADACPVKDAGSTNGKDIDALESGWQQVFTALPLQEIDLLGISRVGSRFLGGHDNWAVVKRLLRPVLDSDEADSEYQPISYYSYCRVLFQRCFILINGWGWRDCKPILDVLYDFFARRTLYNLRLEESDKSPAFLDELDANPSLEVFLGDSCFHILLKIIASGLRFLSKAYDKKKIRNYTWRLLPNHGRDYPKEQPIHQADLDALRNHHDLLCTLYSSVPDGCRPRLETIKNLVQPATSHLETCKISLRSWTRLARFKLSTNEDISGLEAFAEWHEHFVTEFLKQHSLARKEVEAQNDGGKQFSQRLIDRTVAQNQRKIESVLKMALQGLQIAIKSASTLEHAQKIVSQTPIKSILDLFDSRTPRLNATVSEGLQVIVMYIQKCTSRSTGSLTTRLENPPISADEDSQEYGDWADIEAAYGYESSPITPGIEHVEGVFHPAVSRLVSNCFGEDRCPDDAILLEIVDCWTSVAHTLVKHGLRRWDSYVSPYGDYSWLALRWTTQTRKFTTQFLAKCIEKDGQILSECKVQILGMWLSSLVERASMLKFQHRFTEAILNQDAEDPVLENLPFSRDPKEGRYLITSLELSQRRLTLISSLLSNMRSHIQFLDDTKSRELSTTRQEYREVIQKMMSSMKANYQELGNREAETRGAYVDFVHSIVGFLQQHTRDICPIDSFFTDTASFPLPSTDPTYIVARLKSYEPKLSSAKVAKTLVIFVQGVTERAALDGQQTYLVNQLHDSMAETYEAGYSDQPTLRVSLLQGVFPAYLATAFNNPAAWILSRPIIETITRVFKDLLFNMDATDPGCVRSVVKIFSVIFESSYRALHRTIINTNMLNQPTVLITTTAFLEMITSTLPVVDYIDRLATDTNSTGPIIAQIRSFQQLALFILSNLQNRSQQSPDSPLNLAIPTEPLPETLSQSSTSDISLSATRELQTYINESWSKHQGKYYFTRRGGHPPQEVMIEAPISAKLDHLPTKGLIDAATALLDALDDLDLFGEGEDGVDHHLQFQSDLVWEDELVLL